MRAILNQLKDPYRLVIGLFYGSGLRLTECLNLRVKDIVFHNNTIHIDASKGAKDPITVLPAQLVQGIQQPIARGRQNHQQDLARGSDCLALPFALDRKCPNGCRQLAWQFLFLLPPPGLTSHLEHKRFFRCHLHPSHIRKQLNMAKKRAKIVKHTTCHSCRHSFATRLLEANDDIRTDDIRNDDIRNIEELMGHSDIKTTQTCTHVVNRGANGVVSPLAALSL